MSSPATDSRLRLCPFTGEWRLVARFRAGQRCRSCKSYLSAGCFSPSRILKRDYECRRCHATRCSRERLAGTRGKTAARRVASTHNAKGVTP